MLTCSHVQIDKKNAKIIEYCYFQVFSHLWSFVVMIAVLWIYLKICFLVKQYRNYTLKKGWPFNILRTRVVHLYYARARCEYIGYSWFPVYFTQYFIAVSLKFVLVLVFISLTILQSYNDPKANSTSKVGDVS